MVSKTDYRRSGTLRTDKVHQYWLDRANNNTDNLVDLIGQRAVDNILYGDGKDCYACGSPRHLNKCHVIPNSCGGSASDPENLFLMCSDCHQQNPDTIYPDMFWHFVKTREPYMDSTIKDIYRILKNLKAGASDNELEIFDRFSGLSYKDMVDLYRSIPYTESSTTLNNQMSIATHVSVIWKNVMMDDWLTRPKASGLDTESVAS